MEANVEEVVSKILIHNRNKIKLLKSKETFFTVKVDQACILEIFSSK